MCPASSPLFAGARTGVDMAAPRACTRNSRPGSSGCGRLRRRCPRDVLPLPQFAGCCHGPRVDAGAGGRRPCRAVRRRVARRGLRGQLCSDVINSLNDLWCGDDDGVGFAHEHSSRAQELVLGRVEKAVESFGPPPPGLTGPGALEALRVCGPGGYEVDAQGARAGFNAPRVALPGEGSVPTPLERLWGADGRDFVETFCQTQALPRSCATAHLEK